MSNMSSSNSGCGASICGLIEYWWSSSCSRGPPLSVQLCKAGIGKLKKWYNFLFTIYLCFVHVYSFNITHAFSFSTCTLYMFFFKREMTFNNLCYWSSFSMYIVLEMALSSLMLPLSLSLQRRVVKKEKRLNLGQIIPTERWMMSFFCSVKVSSLSLPYKVIDYSASRSRKEPETIIVFTFCVQSEQNVQECWVFLPPSLLPVCWTFKQLHCAINLSSYPMF